MFINLLRIAIIFFTFGTVDILETYTLHSIDNIVYEDLSLRDIFEDSVLFNDTYDTDLNYYDLSFITGDTFLENGQLKIFSNSTSFINKDLLLIQNESYYISYKTIVIRYESGNLGLRFNNAASTLITFFSPTTIGTHNNSTIISNTFIGIDSFWFGNSYSGNADVYYDNLFILPMSIFAIAPTQTQLDEWLSDYLEYKDNPSFEYTFKTLGIEHLILFTSSMLFWFYSLKLLRKAVK